MSNFAFFIPVFVGIIYLFSSLAFKSDNVFNGTVVFHLPPIAVVLFPVVWVILKYGLRSNQADRNFWLYLCFLSPLAVIYPWVITNGTASADYGGFLYFIEWLTKHPNLGPFNIQVLIGIVCVIAIAFLPALYADQALSDNPQLGKLILVFSVFLLLFAPVLVRLDLMLWISGWNGESLQNSSGEQLGGFALFYGPLLHATSFVVMIWHIIMVITKKPAHYR